MPTWSDAEKVLILCKIVERSQLLWGTKDVDVNIVTTMFLSEPNIIQNLYCIYVK